MCGVFLAEQQQLNTVKWELTPESPDCLSDFILWQISKYFSNLKSHVHNRSHNKKCTLSLLGFSQKHPRPFGKMITSERKYDCESREHSGSGRQPSRSKKATPYVEGHLNNQGSARVFFLLRVRDESSLINSRQTETWHKWKTWGEGSHQIELRYSIRRSRSREQKNRSFDSTNFIFAGLIVELCRCKLKQSKQFETPPCRFL